ARVKLPRIMARRKSPALPASTSDAAASIVASSPAHDGRIDGSTAPQTPLQPAEGDDVPGASESLYVALQAPLDAAARLAAANMSATSSRFAPFQESYTDMNELRRALKVVSVQRNAPYYMQHSSPQRVEARCPTWRQRKQRGPGGSAVPACDFVVSANRHANGRVYVTRAVVSHSPSCSVLHARLAANANGSGVASSGSNSSEGPAVRANSVSAAALLETAKPFMGQLANALGGGDAVKPKDMANIMKEKFGVSASYMTAWRALSAFRQQRKLEDATSYMKLHGYLQAFAASNDGSLVAFEHQDNAVPAASTPATRVFARAFLCPKPLQDALRYCRGNLLLSVFLITSAFGGVVLTATAQDAMGDNVPLAIALAPAETEHDWRFFLQHLRRAFPDMDRSVTSLVHNRGDELTQAAHTVFPNCAQSNDVELFVRNAAPIIASASDAGVAAMGSSSTVPGAGATSTATLATDSSMQWMEALCAKAPLMILVGWVSQVARTLFQRYERYGHMSSEYPAEFHALAAQYEGEAARFDVVRIAESGFEVIDKQSGRPRVVDFAKQTCSCGEYDTSRFPCLHVFLAVSYAGMLRTDVIPRIFLMTSLKALYGGRIMPIDIDTVPSDEVTVPQPLAKGRGRPRKVHQIQQFGDVKQEKLSCSVCGVKGHNKRTCKRLTEAAATPANGSAATLAHDEEEKDSGDVTDGQVDATFFVSAYGDSLPFDNSALGGNGAGSHDQSLGLSAGLPSAAKRRRLATSSSAVDADKKSGEEHDGGVALV
ncbi:hypothetical protein BBJ28_00011779, partial [Nothophytophthora sp. Chile5]